MIYTSSCSKVVDAIKLLAVPNTDYSKLFVKYKGGECWKPVQLAPVFTPSLQEVRDTDRNISMEKGDFDDAHFYLRSLQGNNMTTAYYTNNLGGGIQSLNTSGWASLHLQPEGGLLTYNGKEVATVNDLPVVNNGMLTVNFNANQVGVFTANQQAGTIININETDPVYNSRGSRRATNRTNNTPVTTNTLTFDFRNPTNPLVPSDYLGGGLYNELIPSSKLGLPMPFNEAYYFNVLTLINHGFSAGATSYTSGIGYSTNLLSQLIVGQDMVGVRSQTDYQTDSFKSIKWLADRGWVEAKGYTSNLGTVISVGINGSGALSFSGGPVTTSGVITAGWSGTTAQYVRGDGSLQAFPTIPSAANDGVLTLRKEGNIVGTFSANQSSNVTLNIVETDPLSIKKLSPIRANANHWDSNNEIFHVVASPVGAPFTWGHWTGINFSDSTGSGLQLIIAPGATDDHLYLRRYLSSTAGSWKALAYVSDIVSYTGSTSVMLSGTSFQRAAFTGDVTAVQNSNSLTIANQAVTFAKMQNIAAQTLLGRYSTGSGSVQPITLGTGLTLNSSGVLSATGAGGSVTSINVLGAGALGFTGGPITAAGVITAGWGGTPTQYVRGDGSLATFPAIPATPNNGQLTIQKEGSNIGTFTADQATNSTINIVETDPLSIKKISPIRTDLSYWSADNEIFNIPSSSTGAPFTWGSWLGINFSKSANEGIQLAIAPSATDDHLYLRRYTSGLPGAYKAIAYTSDILSFAGSTSVLLSGNTFQRAALTGDVIAAQNSNSLTIANQAVTFAKMQNIPTQTLLGRYSTGSGSVQPIILGIGLTLNSSGVLSATASGSIDKDNNDYSYHNDPNSKGWVTNGAFNSGIKTILSSQTTNYVVEDVDYTLVFFSDMSSSFDVELPDPTQYPGRILHITNGNSSLYPSDALAINFMGVFPIRSFSEDTSSYTDIQQLFPKNSNGTVLILGEIPLQINSISIQSTGEDWIVYDESFSFIIP